MTTYALPRMPHGTVQRIWWYLVAVPWRGLGLYSPQALLALPAAYASSQFAAHHDVFPPPFNGMVGVAFEWVYLGTLAVAGAQRAELDPKARWYQRVNWWYIIVNLLAVMTSIVYVTLHAADKYELFGNPTNEMLWFFAVTHGAPLALINFFYGLLIHAHLRTVAEQDALTAYPCPTCGLGFKSPAALNGHRKGCKPASP